MGVKNVSKCRNYILQPEKLHFKVQVKKQNLNFAASATMLIALSQGSIPIPSWGAVCNKKSKRQLVSSQVQTVSIVLINSN